MQFSQRLKELRKEQNLTQAQLATALNYGYTAIANYESGRKENFEEVYNKIIAESSQCFLKTILQLLQNELYYNIMKQSIINELSI